MAGAQQQTETSCSAVVRTRLSENGRDAHPRISPVGLCLLLILAFSSGCTTMRVIDLSTTMPAAHAHRVVSR